MEDFGFLLGIAANIVAQFFIWRYLFVYYLLGGDKTRYEQKKVAYNFLFILVGAIAYTMVDALANALIALILIAALIYFALSLHRKWKRYERLPHPFESTAAQSNEIFSYLSLL